MMVSTWDTVRHDQTNKFRSEYGVQHGVERDVIGILSWGFMGINAALHHHGDIRT